MNHVQLSGAQRRKRAKDNEQKNLYVEYKTRKLKTRIDRSISEKKGHQNWYCKCLGHQ